MTPDLWCFGKVIGGGLPVGAFGGRRDLMAELAPGGPVYQAGTLSGNPLATAAGLAVLDAVTAADYEALTARVALFAKDLESAVAGGGLAVAVPTVGPLVGFFVGPAEAGPLAPPTDYESAPGDRVGGDLLPASSTPCSAAASRWRPGAYEVMFPGLAHDDAVLARVVDAAGEAAAEVSRLRRRATQNERMTDVRAP